MTNTTTERRLAITPGEVAHVEQLGMCEVWGTRLVLSSRTTGPVAYIPNEHDATLYADAHNTYNACHLTPSELLAKLREAVKYARHDEDCGTNAARGSYASCMEAKLRQDWETIRLLKKARHGYDCPFGIEQDMINAGHANPTNDPQPCTCGLSSHLSKLLEPFT